ncbi:MAG: type II secretion system F family protein [Xanthobacteraceae bacterium]|nr:type II secretion system F family protein [Xanthobacteraceae bacterium]
MDTILEYFFFDYADDNSTFMLGLLVFLAVSTLAFGVMAAIRVRGSVKRRAADIASDGPRRSAAANSRSLRHASVKAGQRLIDYTTKHYSASNEKNMRMLRRRLVQAGFLDPRTAAFFFIARTALAVGLGVGAFFIIPIVSPDTKAMFWPLVGLCGLVGYFSPGFYISRRVTNRQTEHRAGFPDFMDLLVVCADAGLSMDAALDRVGRELTDSYPSLGANIHMTTLEMRAGRSLSDALEHLGDRLGLEGARSFATLLQQSEELGSSMTEALRVYSDDMRHKRLSRAEEKAYSLPAKLSVPLVLCVFPVLVIVIMLPAYVRLKLGGY